MSLVLRLVPPNDVSCSRSGSQVDPPTGVTERRGIVSPIGSSGLDSCSPKGPILTSAIFYPFTKKMTSCNIYPTAPSAPEDPQVNFHLSTIQSKRQGLLKLEERYKKKSKQYTKILDRLMWLTACSSGLSAATSGAVTLATFIGLSVSIPLGAVTLAGAGVSGMATALTKKYQKELSKVMKLVNIIMPAIAVFERVVSIALKNGKIDEEEFNSLQTLHIEKINKLTGIDHKMEAENRIQFEKAYWKRYTI